MYSLEDRRKRSRIRYIWPLWYGTEEAGALNSGQVVDLADEGISFKVNCEHCPCPGQHIFVSFSYPVETSEQFDMGSYRNWGEVIRVDSCYHNQRRIVVRLNPPLELETSLGSAEKNALETQW